MATDYTIPKDEYRALIAENAKLRDELDQWHRLTAGIELPEYPITEFKPKDLERENAKLRELCADMLNYFTEPVSKRNNLKERFARLDDIGDRMHELGVEVE